MVPFLTLDYALIALASYLLGSFPTGYLLTKWSGGGDIRHVGSGSIGVTNVLRTGKKYLALITLIVDAFKGYLAITLTQYFLSDATIVAAVAVLLGHIYPIWLQFKGGKGIATSLGVMLAMSMPLGLFALGLWMVVVGTTRYSSLASLISAASLWPLSYFFYDTPLFGLMVILPCITLFTHRDNIKRLHNGTESKIGKSAKKGDA